MSGEAELLNRLDWAGARIAELEQENVRLQEYHAQGRYNIDRTSKGLRVCFGLHGSEEPCEWVYYEPAEEVKGGT